MGVSGIQSNYAETPYGDIRNTEQAIACANGVSRARWVNPSLGFIANYHALLTSLHSNWEIVNEHLGKCADERDI